jgi:hypothetical protein
MRPVLLTGLWPTAWAVSEIAPLCIRGPNTLSEKKPRNSKTENVIIFYVIWAIAHLRRP